MGRKSGNLPIETKISDLKKLAKLTFKKLTSVSHTPENREANATSSPNFYASKFERKRRKRRGAAEGPLPGCLTAQLIDWTRLPACLPACLNGPASCLRRSVSCQSLTRYFLMISNAARTAFCLDRAARPRLHAPAPVLPCPET